MKTRIINKAVWAAVCLLGTVTAHAQFSQTAKVVSQDREGRAEYGTAVDIKDNYAIVGASRESVAAGAAYIYHKSSEGIWSDAQKITAFDAQEMAEFGGGAKFGDDFLVIASGRGDVEGVIRAGALYTYNFNKSNSTWEFDVKLHAADYNGDAKLGMNPTCLDVEGSTIVGGAPGDNGWTGAAYVFEREAGVWAEKQKIVSPNPQTNETFGIGVSISGNWMAIGANETDNRKGAVYMYEKNSAGLWEYKQQVMASNATPDSFFGCSVSIYQDQLAVGAYGTNAEAGAAYLFQQDSNGEWQEVQTLQGHTSSEAAQFGWNTEIKEKHLVVSAPHAYGFEPGEVYFYKRDSGGEWQEEEIIQGEDTVGEDFYGWSVALHDDQIITGAPWEDHDAEGTNEIDRAGSAYIFRDETLLSNAAIQNLIPNAITVYPVPAHQQINIRAHTMAIHSIALIDQLGKVVKKYTIPAKMQHTINMESVANGVYILNIQTEQGEIHTQKIVKVSE